MKQDILRCDNISKSFQDFQLRNISISIDTPGIFFINGSSGSGKTSLLNIIGLLSDVEDGNVFILGKNVNSNNQCIKQSIGYSFQQQRLIEYISVIENTTIKSIISDHKKDKYQMTAMNLLKIFNLNPYKKTKFLSGGQKQIISVIRAICFEPIFTILDEPFNNMDIENIEKICYILNDLKCKIPIILASHQMPKKLYIDRTYIIENGTIH